MTALAPKICPVCDTTYDELQHAEDMPRISYFHFALHRLCIKTENQQGIQLRLMETGLAVRHSAE